MYNLNINCKVYVLLRCGAPGFGKIFYKEQDGKMLGFGGHKISATTFGPTIELEEHT